MKPAVLILTLVCGLSSSFAEERKQLVDIEEVVLENLKSEDQKAFYEMFFFSSTTEHRNAILDEVHDMFARHFRSGIGKVSVWPLTDENFHKEVIGELKAADLYRAPGPPFAYLNVFPVDETDPEYMGLNFRLARIDGETRIVFLQHEPGVPQFLDENVSTWERATNIQFEARLVRVIDGQVHFRTSEDEPLIIELIELSKNDQMRINALTSKANKGRQATASPSPAA